MDHVSVSNTDPIDRGRNAGGLTLIAAASLIAACWSAGVAAQQLFKWTDEQGEVHYTDQVPPSQADKARARLSGEGVQVEEVPRAPTAEEIQAAMDLERQKAQEAERLAEQRAEDERLLQTYRTIEDLELARDGKIAAVDALIQVKRDGVRAETARLIELHAEVKDLEKAKKPVPVALMDEIDASVIRIREGYAEVVKNEYRKQDIRNGLKDTVAHYRRLKRLPEPTEPMTPESELKLSILVPCRGQAQCGRYWARANDYVRDHSDSKKEVSGPGLLITFQRDEREDRSLTLSWTQDAADKPVHLYLDVQCKNRLTGSLYCVNPTIPQIRDGFQAAIVQGEDAD